MQFTKNIKDYIKRPFRYCWCHSHWWARVQDLGDIVSKETFQVPVNLLCSLHSAAPLLFHTVSASLSRQVWLHRETSHGHCLPEAWRLGDCFWDSRFRTCLAPFSPFPFCNECYILVLPLYFKVWFMLLVLSWRTFCFQIHWTLNLPLM